MAIIQMERASLGAFKEAAGTGFNGKKVVMIGAGGVARPIAVKIAMDGAEKISIVNRTTQKSVELAEVVNENIAEIVQVYNFEDKTLKMAFEESDVIINTTSVGMSPILINHRLRMPITSEAVR